MESDPKTVVTCIKRTKSLTRSLVNVSSGFSWSLAQELQEVRV
jgi:hypothetical protein